MNAIDEELKNKILTLYNLKILAKIRIHLSATHYKPLTRTKYREFCERAKQEIKTQHSVYEEIVERVLK